MSLKRRLLPLATRLLARATRFSGPRSLAFVAAAARRAGIGRRGDADALRANLRMYFPERDDAWVAATARAIEASAFRAKVLDKHVLPRLTSDELERTCEWESDEALARALADGRGVVLVSMHYGRYWAAPVLLSRRGATVLAFQRGKGRLPEIAATLSGGTLDATDPSSALRATRGLRKGAVVGILLDAGRVQRPLVVDFLGFPTAVTAAPLELARAADALVIPTLAFDSNRTGARIRLVCGSAVDPRELDADDPPERVIRRALEIFEERIRAEPSQWYGAVNAHRRLVR